MKPYIKRRYFNPYFIILLFAFVLIAGGMLWWQTLSEHSEDGGVFVPKATEYTLSKDAPLFLTQSGDKSIMLKAGQRVKILARHDKDAGIYFVAELPDGRRGVLALYDEGLAPKYVCSQSGGGYKMTTNQFYEECIGRRFDEFDGKYRRTIFLPENPNRAKTVEVSMPFILRNTNGWKAFEPTVIYTDGVATDVHFNRMNVGNRLILRIAPFAGWLLEKEWVQRLISKPQFVEYQPEQEKTFADYFAAFVRLVGLLLYVGLCCSIPLFAIVVLLLYVPSRFFGGKVFIVGLSIALVCASYLWLLVMMMEGYSWWWVWLPTVVFIYINIAVYAFAATSQCPNCRHIGTLERIKSVYKDSDYHTSTREERKHYVYCSTVNGKVKETTYREDPYHGREPIKEEIKDGKIDIERGWTDINTYELVHKISTYDNWYKCAKCGYVHKREEDEWKLISKRLIASETIDEYEEREARDEEKYKYY